MTRLRAGIVALLKWMAIVVPATLLLVYFANPFGVQSLDPRQRILGHGLYRIPAGGMEPTIRPGEVAVTRVGRSAVDSLARGDIVTFLVPEEQGALWLKRIVGLPGETIEIDGGVVLIDGQPLPEPYVAEENRRADYSRHMAPVMIPAGRYFLLGDNRDRSMDSRWLAPTRHEDVTGKVVLVP